MSATIRSIRSGRKEHDRSFLPAALRATVGVAARLAPAPTAELAAAAFLRPRRFPLPEREAAALAAARRVALPSRFGELAAWAWGEAPYVALVHGWEGRAGQLGAFVGPLAARGFGCVAVDAPGHGASPGRTSSLVAIAASLTALAERFGPLAGVVAHSAGGVATTFALGRGLAVPAVAFLATGADLGHYARFYFGLAGLPQRLEPRFRGAVARRVGVPWEELDPRRTASRLAVPLLAVHDRDDREAPIDGVEELVARWPGAALERTSGLGHRRLLRDPAVVEAVAAHLARHAATPVSSEAAS